MGRGRSIKDTLSSAPVKGFRMNTTHFLMYPITRCLKSRLYKCKHAESQHHSFVIAIIDKRCFILRTLRSKYL